MECDCCDGREPATLAEVNALVKGIRPDAWAEYSDREHLVITVKYPGTGRSSFGWYSWRSAWHWVKNIEKLTNFLNPKESP